MSTVDLSRIPLDVTTVHAILTKLIEKGEGDSPAFVQIDGREVPLRSVSERMGEKHIKFCGHTQSQ